MEKIAMKNKTYGKYQIRHKHRQIWPDLSEAQALLNQGGGRVGLKGANLQR